MDPSQEYERRYEIYSINLQIVYQKSEINRTNQRVKIEMFYIQASLRNNYLLALL